MSEQVASLKSLQANKEAQVSILKCIRDMMCEGSTIKDWEYVINKQITRITDELKQIQNELSNA